MVIGILIALALAGVFGWLATRAWRARHPLVKWPSVVLTGLVAVVCAAIGIGAGIGAYRLQAPVNRPVPNVQVAGTPDQIARGERLAHLCATCHASGGSLPLDGGTENFLGEGDGLGFGTLYAPNLTPGGELAHWSDGEIVRAIREGIRRDGRPLLLMPSDELRQLGDDDVEAIVAYLRSQPAVNRTTPPNGMNFLGSVLVGFGVFPMAVQPPVDGPVVAPAAEPTAERGEYLVGLAGCRSCHGVALAGNPPSDFGPPWGPDLTASAPHWSADEFVAAIRDGVTPSGRTLSPEAMPWPQFSAAFTDDDLRAIHAYLREVSSD